MRVGSPSHGEIISNNGWRSIWTLASEYSWNIHQGGDKAQYRRNHITYIRSVIAVRNWAHRFDELCAIMHPVPNYAAHECRLIKTVLPSDDHDSWNRDVSWLGIVPPWSKCDLFLVVRNNSTFPINLKVWRSCCKELKRCDLDNENVSYDTLHQTVLWHATKCVDKKSHCFLSSGSENKQFVTVL